MPLGAKISVACTELFPPPGDATGEATGDGLGEITAAGLLVVELLGMYVAPTAQRLALRVPLALPSEATANVPVISNAGTLTFVGFGVGDALGETLGEGLGLGLGDGLGLELAWANAIPALRTEADASNIA